MWYFRHLENVVDQSTSGWVGARRICQPKDKFPWASFTFIEDYSYVQFYPRLPGSPQKKSTATLDVPINAPHAYELVLYFGNTKQPTVPIGLEVKSPLPMHHIPGSTPKGDLLR